MEAGVPDDSRGFLPVLRAGSLTECARGGSAQSGAQACGLLAPHDAEAATAGVVPLACAARHLCSAFQREGKEQTTQPWPVGQRRKIPS